MRYLARALPVLAALAFAAPASAEWGWNGQGCSFTRHCYAAAVSGAERLAWSANLSGVADSLSAEVFRETFVTSELWATFNGDCWVEGGFIYQNANAGELDPFIAAKSCTSGAFYFKRFATATTDASGAAFLIYDHAGNGEWEVAYQPAGYEVGEHYKVDLGTYALGFPARAFGEAGVEIATSVQPYARGTVEAARADQGCSRPWWEASACPEGREGWGWQDTTLPPSPPQLEVSSWGPGDLSWASTPPAGTAAATYTPPAKPYAKAGQMLVSTGTKLAAPLAPRPRGLPKPTGAYRALVRDARKQIVAEYVGNAPPDEALVLKGGAE